MTDAAVVCSATGGPNTLDGVEALCSAKWLNSSNQNGAF